MLLLRLSYQDHTVELETLLKSLGEEAPMARPESMRQRPVRALPPLDGAQESPPVPPSSPSSEKVSPPSLREAWRRLLDAPKKLPGGVPTALNTATVETEGESILRLRVPAGPLKERLEDPATLQALKRRLGDMGLQGVEIQVADSGEGEVGSGRITEETVKNGRLKDLVQKEPRLGEAVKELDLELLD
jgi:hypothetical protein